MDHGCTLRTSGVAAEGERRTRQPLLNERPCQLLLRQLGAFSEHVYDRVSRVAESRFDEITFVGDNDLVYAKTAQLPGRNIDSKVVNYFGQEFQVPGRSTYPEAGGYTISFYHDEDCQLRTKFEAASRIVFNNETSLGQYGMPGEESVINLVQVDKQLNDVRNTGRH